IIEKELEEIIHKAIAYLDNTILAQYQVQLKQNKEPHYWHALEYLYMRSFYTQIPLKDRRALEYYYNHAL
ncbi:hypothetical protein ACSTHW_23430, partial [Vibrio parahaemolyticus]